MRNIHVSVLLVPKSKVSKSSGLSGKHRNEEEEKPCFAVLLVKLENPLLLSAAPCMISFALQPFRRGFEQKFDHRSL